MPEFAPRRPRQDVRVCDAGLAASGSEKGPDAADDSTDGPRCPACGETTLIEFDATLRSWSCAVCSRQWAPRRTASAWERSVVAEVHYRLRVRTSQHWARLGVRGEA